MLLEAEEISAGERMRPDDTFGGGRKSAIKGRKFDEWGRTFHRC
jgi:hypothetical protein